eukprot:6987887-Pyramimonas_sp.AAC.1
MVLGALAVALRLPEGDRLSVLEAMGGVAKGAAGAEHMLQGWGCFRNAQLPNLNDGSTEGLVDVAVGAGFNGGLMVAHRWHLEDWGTLVIRHAAGGLRYVVDAVGANTRVVSRKEAWGST